MKNKRIYILIIFLIVLIYYFSPKQKTVDNTDFSKLDYNHQLETIKSMALKDPSKAWLFIKQKFIINGQVVGNAHGFAHIVGNASFKKSGIEGIKICDSSFAFGCFHGVTESMLLSGGLSKVKEIENECLQLFPKDKTQDYTGCIHGTGHGLFEWETGDLKKALLDCDIISHENRQYCYDGVFMENSNELKDRTIDEKNPWKLCFNLESRYHRNCARYQSQIFLGQFGSPNSPTLVGRYCSVAPSSLLKNTCYESLGYYVAQTNLGKPDLIFQSCSKMPDTDGREMCTKGGAVETVFQKYEGFKDSSIILCKKLREPNQSLCLNNIENMLSQNVQN